MRDVAAVAAAALTDDAPVFGYVGGGGYTLPLYFEATYPGSTHVVYEIDGQMVDEVTETLGIDDRAQRFPTRVGDARAEVATSDEDSMDLVAGDAFSGISVPWHLTTREFLDDVDRVLTPGGIYVMNLIDYDDYDLARAEARTFQEVFEDVMVIAPPSILDGSNRQGSNFILVGGDDLPAADVIRDALDPSAALADDVALGTFIGDAEVLTDEFAPVDQLLGRP